MKRFLFKLLFFLLIIGLTYPTIVVGFQELAPSRIKRNVNYKRGSYGHLNSRIKDIQNFKDIDILFLGSSHCYRGFDPRIFKPYGYTTFNLGSSAQSHIQTNILLSRHLESLFPKLVIYEVYPGTMVTDGVESSLDLIANDRNDWLTLKMIWSTMNLKVLNTAIYGFYTDFLGKDKNYKEPVRKENHRDTYISGGFVQKDVKTYQYDSMKKGTYTFNPIQLEHFRKNLEFLKQGGIPYILVQAPITKARYNAKTNNQEYTKLMSTYGTYLDFNTKLNLDDSLYFYDSHHLNQNGVELFNVSLIKFLQTK